MWPFDDIGNLFSSTPGGAGGAGGLTPDQQQMQQQMGWYPRPDMVLPTGSTMQQPAGYSGLTPAQATTVNQLGYFTGTPGDTGSSGQSLWSKAIAALGGEGGKDLKSALSGIGQNLTPARPMTMPPPGLLHPGLGNPYSNLYTPHIWDPKAALQRFQRGY